MGVDITDEQLDKAARLRDGGEYAPRRVRRVPHRGAAFEDASFDAVISNGVIINSRRARTSCSPRRRGCLRPGGRLALADIVSGRALKERTGATSTVGRVHRGRHPPAQLPRGARSLGLQVRAIRSNDYRFISERALGACSAYEVESVSLVAVKPAERAAQY